MTALFCMSLPKDVAGEVHVSARPLSASLLFFTSIHILILQFRAIIDIYHHFRHEPQATAWARVRDLILLWVLRGVLHVAIMAVVCWTAGYQLWDWVPWGQLSYER